MEYGGQVVGELLVGLRPGERELATADQKVLDLVAAPLAVAVHATWLSAELQASRGRIIAAREEERRRLRRDLHDGLGPTLTGLALAADAAANLMDSDVTRTRELLTSLRTDARSAIGDIRRLVDDLRPPALDELGFGDKSGAAAVTVTCTRSASARSSGAISAILSRTACRPSAFLAPFLPSARSSAARSFIAARSSALKPSDSALVFFEGISASLLDAQGLMS